LNDSERLEKIQKVLDKLSILARDHTILIEGHKDKRALDSLGVIASDIFFVQADGGPMKAAEYVFGNSKKAVILTDWDKKGELIAYELSVQLKDMGIEVDTSIRSELIDLCICYIKDVESLDSLVKRLHNKVRGPTGMIY